MKAERAQMSSPLQQKEEPIPGSSREKPSENVGGLTDLKTSDDLLTKSVLVHISLKYQKVDLPNNNSVLLRESDCPMLRSDNTKNVNV
jgi:hypothetical protein